jgi:DNA repair protein RecN (Recombination protein N)
MVLGERAEAIVVRSGAERAEVGAEFDVGGRADVARWLKEHDLAGDDGTLLMRRVIEANGRSRGFINGHVATLAQLREAGEQQVDIHGQHQHQSLLRGTAQRELLDAYGGQADAAARVASLYRDWQKRRDSRIAFEANAAAFAAEREQLEWQAREIAALKFTADEWPELTAEHSRLAHGANLIESAQFGVEALAEGENSSLSQLNAIVGKLGGLVEHDPKLREILDALDSARIQLQEGVHALRHYGERLELDPQRLREVESRLDAIHTAARKYRIAPEELQAKLEAANARLQELGEGGSVDALRKLEEEGHAGCVAEARKLSAARRKTAKKLSDEVTEAMQQLAMAGGKFEIALHAAPEITAHGLHAAATTGQGSFRRRALAPEPRRADRHEPSGTSSDADLRRSGRRHRWAGGGDRGQDASTTGAEAPGDVHHPPAAGCSDGRPAMAGCQEHGERESLEPGYGPRPGTARGGNCAHAGRREDHRDDAQARG